MRTIATFGAVLVALVFAQPAIASYYLSEGQAEHYTRSKLHNDLGYHYTAAYCRPQGRSAPQKGYIYHRWSCGWIATDNRSEVNCRGLSVVAGSRESGTYYWRVDYHRGACDWGWS